MRCFGHPMCPGQGTIGQCEEMGACVKHEGEHAEGTLDGAVVLLQEADEIYAKTVSVNFDAENPIA